MDGADYTKAARILPHNIEAEQALLGAILIDNRALDRVSTLQPWHFHDPLHGKIYEALTHLIQSGQVATPITVKPFFDAAAPISDGLNVMQYLGRLAVQATTTANAPGYAQVIRDTATRRELIAIGEDMVAVAYDSPIDAAPKDQITAAEAALFAIAEKGTNEHDMLSIDAAMTVASETINAAFKRNGGLAGLSVGIPSLDTAIGGLSPGNLLIIAGRPGMGKSALAANIAFNIAQSGAGRVGFFSLEMSAEELAMRLLAEHSGIPAWQMRQGKVSGIEAGNLMRGARAFGKTPLFIDQSGGLTFGQFAARARRMARKQSVNVIVLDYLQLLGGTKQSFSRTQEVTEITNGLKALAKELNIPIVALAQLSREVEKRADKRPQLSDLRDSGSIEQDADVVMFVYREEYYLDRIKPDQSDLGAGLDWEAKKKACEGKAEVIVAKHRHAPTGTVYLAFHAPTTTFSEATP